MLKLFGSMLVSLYSGAVCTCLPMYQFDHLILLTWVTSRPQWADSCRPGMEGRWRTLWHRRCCCRSRQDTYSTGLEEPTKGLDPREWAATATTSCGKLNRARSFDARLCRVSTEFLDTKYANSLMVDSVLWELTAWSKLLWAFYNVTTIDHSFLEMTITTNICGGQLSQGNM